MDDILARALGVDPSQIGAAPVDSAPITDPAPAAEAPKDEPAPQEPKSGEPDYATILKEKTGGRVSKFEDLTPFFESHDTLPSLTEQLNQYRSKAEQLEAESQKRFANPLVEMINGLYESGATEAQIQTALKIQSLDIDALNGIDAKAQRLMYEKGWTKEEALDEIHASYKLDENKYEAEEIERDKKRLDRNKAEDLKFLKDLKKEATTIARGPDPEQVKAEQARKAVFENQVSSFTAGIAGQHIGLGPLELVKAEDGKEGISLEINFSDEFKKQAPEFAKNFMLSQGMKPGPESEAAVKDYLTNLYYATHGKEIARTVARHVESVTLEREVARLSNRGGRQATDNNIPNAGAPTTIAELARAGLNGPAKKSVFG